jgi:hypothetical protein
MIAWICTLAMGSPLVDALEEELERADDLSLPDAPPLYRLRHHLVDADQYELETSFGSVLSEDGRPYHALGAEVRVGSPSFDNTGFGGWEDGFLRRGLPIEPTPLAVRQVAWQTTDRAYKQAVEQHARKSAQFDPPPDHPGDYWPPAPVVGDDGAPPPLTTEPIRSSALAMSEAFVPVGDRLLRGDVHVGAESGDVWLVDTEGTRLRRPLAEVSVRAMAALRTDDGELLTDDRLWTVRDASQLPAQDDMVAAVERMRDALVARADAPALDDEYVGPVVFEGDAALALYRYLLIPQLEGTPAEIPFDSWFGDLGEQKGTVRLGRRVLPEGWSVVDDPLAEPGHPSSFVHDWDGTPTERVELVGDGIVRDLLMSTVPRKGLEPNGHGRSFLGERANGRAAQTMVSAPKVKSTKVLIKRGLRMASAYGLDHIVVIRRLQEYSAISHAGGSTGGFGEGPTLPPPVEIVRRYADGREEVVRGATFAGVERFILRDIALAGPERSTTYLAPSSGEPHYMAPIEGMPTLLRGHDVLVREIELVPVSRDPRDTPVLRME